jgi:hypothetical protein
MSQNSRRDLNIELWNAWLPAFQFLQELVSLDLMLEEAPEELQIMPDVVALSALVESPHLACPCIVRP